MRFGEKLRELRVRRQMTLCELGIETGMDYVVLNKIELGLRLPPPLEGIMALSDALGLVEDEFEELLDLAAQDNGDAGPRFTSDQVRRIKESQAAKAFFTRRVKSEGGGEC